MATLDSMEMEPEYGGMDKFMEPEDDEIKYCPGMEVDHPTPSEDIKLTVAKYGQTGIDMDRTNPVWRTNYCLEQK